MKSEDIQAIFGMQPEAAIAYLESKKIHVSWDWQDMLDDAHATAFTVAKTAKMDVIDDIYSAVLKAAANGQTFEQFSDELTPVLQRKGWWGKQDVVHPETGEAQAVKLGSPHRLKTIYLTNMQSAYMAGRYVEMIEAVETHPYWMYISVMDNRTRPSHAALHGMVYEAEDGFWNSMYPPLDFRCRCRVRPLSEARGKGRVLPSPKMETKVVDIGRNEFTGEERFAERIGIRVDGKFIAPNAGFNGNQGKSMLQSMARTAVDKAQATHPDIARVALKDMMKNERFKNSLTESQRQWVNKLLGDSNVV